MRIPLTAALSLALLTACATPTQTTTGTPPPSAALPPTSEDTCGAATYASRLGNDYREVPAAPAGRTFRVVCTTCAMTKDYSAQRLNFFYDASTGKVVRLTCG
jgi:hypothetical protein